MRRAARLALVVWLASCAVVGPVRIEDGPAVRLTISTVTLSTGLRVFLSGDERQPIASVSLVIGAGSAQDPPGKAGLAHHVEHLVFAARADGASLQARFEAMGA